MNPLLYRIADVNLAHGLGLRRDETFVVVHDATAPAELVDTFTAAATGLGAEVVVVRYTPHRHIAMVEFGQFADASLLTDPVRLPAPARAALQEADAILVLTSDLEVLFDKAFISAASHARTCMLPYPSVDMVLRLLPASEEQLAELRKTTSAVGNAVAQAKDVHIMSPAGTNLSLQVGEHRVNWAVGVHEPGRGYGGIEIWPGGQISTVPDVATASGVLVIDRSVSAPQYKELLDPVRFNVIDGRVVDVTGGVEATRLADYLEDLDHPDVYHLTEFGLGTNRLCTAAGLAAPCEDTHTLGCVSMALGADVHLGGTTRAPIHLDMTLRRASVTVDGRALVDHGRLSV